MDIVVEGTGRKLVTPDLVNMNLNFFIKGISYEEVLENGVKNVENFVNELLLQNNFKKEDMKTRSFIIKEERKYNNLMGTYEKDGYSFSQNAIITFDYDKMRMANLMVAISKLSIPPICDISFGVKNEAEIKKELMKEAYNDAEKKATVIASAALKKLVTCQKVDFRPFSTPFISNSRLSSDMLCAEKSMIGAANAITSTFTPEDILLTETLYCIWNAE